MADRQRRTNVRILDLWEMLTHGPYKMSLAEVKATLQRIDQQLRDDGWEDVSLCFQEGFDGGAPPYEFALSGSRWERDDEAAARHAAQHRKRK